MLPYIVAQAAGAITAAATLFLIANGQPDFAVGGFAANGYGPLSPGHFDMKSALLAGADGGRGDGRGGSSING